MTKITVKEIEKHNGSIRSVIIAAWPFDIAFGKINNRVTKISVTRLDRDRITSPSDLKIPKEIFNPAVNQARAIFKKYELNELTD